MLLHPPTAPPHIPPLQPSYMRHRPYLIAAYIIVSCVVLIFLVGLFLRIDHLTREIQQLHDMHEPLHVVMTVIRDPQGT
jgi:hypothetical protein